LLAKDVKYKPNLEKLLKSHIGYIDFKHIRISPDYHQQMQKHIFAMIRQLGPPTFFVTFTSAEHLWTPLVQTLTKLHSNRNKEKHIETIEECNIDYLVRKDPVTCTRYYRHKTNALKQLICQDSTFFGKILDYYFVTEFQNRGSAHEHALIWIENAPVYGINSNLEIENFSDNYITCSTNHLDPELTKIHEHHHTKRCKKRKASQCRYKFPMLPMKRTRILEPITSLHGSINEKVLSLQSTLEKKHYDKSTSHEDFLDEF